MADFQTYEIASRRHVGVAAIPWAEPAAEGEVPYPSYLAPVFLKRKELNRLFVDVELNTYPETPSGYYSGYYPGSGLAESNRIEFKVNHLEPLDLDERI
jgi:hypothetical protein